MLQVLSQLLDYVISDERLERFLSEVLVNAWAVAGFGGQPNASISRFTANAPARPGGALYERFLDAVVGHVADLGGTFRCEAIGRPAIMIAECLRPRGDRTRSQCSSNRVWNFLRTEVPARRSEGSRGSP